MWTETFISSGSVHTVFVHRLPYIYIIRINSLLLLLLLLLGTSQRLAFVPLTITVLLGAPMQPTWWVKISTYLRSEWFLSIIFYNLVFKIVNNI
jgi:hypothetical protein